MKEELKIDFEKMNGLIPTIIQDYKSGKVLMLAFMNKEAWEKTLKTGNTWFYSRSRNKLWMKGETSGNIQKVKEILIDCDNDSVLLKVEQKGAACHEGFYSCFFKKLERGKLKIIGNKKFNPEEVYK